MIDVFKVFYSVHYNFAAVSLLLLLIIIFLLTKKNVKVSLILLAIDIAFNVFIWQRTSGKVWTITETVPPASEWDVPTPKDHNFYAPDHWIELSEKGEKLHWCWVETYMQKFLSVNFADKMWGTDKAKNMREASEKRLNQ